MPFGLKNAAQTFQRFMDSILQDLDYIFVYLDDILVASCNKEDHKQHLNVLFDRLQEHGLFVKPEKCWFGREEIEFLGHRVNSQGITPLPSKVTAVLEYSQPSTTKDLERFLGMLNFYHGFVPHAAEKLQ